MPTHDTEAEVTEYRVMWWSGEFNRWFPHAPATENPEVAAAWLDQAKHRGAGRTPAAVQTRQVTPWAFRAALLGHEDRAVSSVPQATEDES